MRKIAIILLMGLLLLGIQHVFGQYEQEINNDVRIYGYLDSDSVKTGYQLLGPDAHVDPDLGVFLYDSGCNCIMLGNGTGWDTIAAGDAVDIPLDVASLGISNVPGVGDTIPVDNAKDWILSWYYVAPVAYSLVIDPAVYTYEYNDGTNLTIDLDYVVQRPNGCGEIDTCTLTPPGVSIAAAIGMAEGTSLPGSVDGITQTANTNTTYTLYIHADNGLFDSYTRSIVWDDQRYWGTDANGTLTDAEVLVFEDPNGDSDFSAASSTGGTSYVFNVSNEHVCIVIPDSETQPTEAQIGFVKTDISSYFNSSSSVAFVNASGGTRGYTKYVSINKYTDSALTVTLFR